MANLQQGDYIVAFDLKGVDGKRYAHNALLNGKKALAVVFSCNHCPYVLGWEDRMIETYRTYAPRGFEMVFINANDSVSHPADSFDRMVEHAREKGFPFPYLHDTSQEVAHAYGAERTPEIFLFDEKAELVYHGAPDDNNDVTLAKRFYLNDAIEATLQGKLPPVSETPPVGCTVKYRN